jgi:hypothetical protein
MCTVQLDRVLRVLFSLIWVWAMVHHDVGAVYHSNRWPQVRTERGFGRAAAANGLS